MKNLAFTRKPLCKSLWVWYVIAPNWGKKPPNVLQLVSSYMDLWYIHTMELYTTRKINQLLIGTTAQVNLRCIMQSEKGQVLKAMCCMLPSLWLSGRGKTVQTENKPAVAKGWEEGGVVNYQADWAGILGWWNCSLFWLWGWLHDYMHLTKATELYTKKGKAQCM